MKIEIDKILHFLTTLSIVLAISYINVIAAIIIAIIASLGKEYYDTIKKIPSGFSYEDLIADGIGIVVAVIWVMINTKL